MIPWADFQQGQFFAASILIMVVMLLVRAPRFATARADAFALFGLASVAGLASARLLWFLLARFSDGARVPLGALVSLEGGVTSLGALGGAAVAFFLATSGDLRARRGVLLDLFVPAGLVSLAIARLGCMARGCDFGVLYDGPMAHQYSDASSPAYRFFASIHAIDAGHTPLLAPFAQWLSMATIAVVLAVAIWSRRGASPGRAAFWMLVGYGVVRWALEFWRHPSTTSSLGWLNTSQWFIIMMVLILALMRRAIVLPGERDGVSEDA